MNTQSPFCSLCEPVSFQCLIITLSGDMSLGGVAKILVRMNYRLLTTLIVSVLLA